MRPLFICLFLILITGSLSQAQEIQAIGLSGRFACQVSTDNFGITTSELIKLNPQGTLKTVSFTKWLRKLKNEIRRWRKKEKNSSNSLQKAQFSLSRERAKSDRKAVKACEKGLVNSSGDDDTTTGGNSLEACMAFQGNSASAFEVQPIVNGEICSDPSAVVRLWIAGSICSGVHIGVGPGSHSWILTASHCVDGNIDAKQITIRAHSSAGEVTKEAVAYYQNPTWVGEYPYIEVNDYALIQVDGIFQNLPSLPPCSNIAAITLGEKQFIAGFGKSLLSSGTLGLDKNLRAGVVLIDELSENTIRATRVGGNKKVSTSCGGDSGGPITGKENGGYCVAGVVSWGTDNYCSATGNTDVAYWSNITSFDGQNFLATHIGELSQVSSLNG